MSRVESWHIKGIRLPERQPIEFWTENGFISLSPVKSARDLSTGGYLLPGLVDSHTHPGTTAPGEPLDEALARTDLVAHRTAGVTTVRVPGVPTRLPDALRTDPSLSHIIDGGPWLFTPGLFLAGWGLEVPEQDLPEQAARQARAGDGWVKLRGDCIVDEETHADPPLLSEAVLRTTVERVHAVGGRVAIHAMHVEACRRAIMASVDSVEHGMWLEHELLPQMADKGIALTPTFSVWARQLDGIQELRSPAREWFLDGYARLGPLTAAAHAAGVTILAGTDSRPHGSIATEVSHLAAGGLSREVALGAACWTARTFFGLANLEHGQPADFVVFDRNPIEDLTVLQHPSQVVLAGALQL
jgi:imidazolonepropionase-like amidohydrolase